jgi:hypothetical protein
MYCPSKVTYVVIVLFTMAAHLLLPAAKALYYSEFEFPSAI